MECNKLDIYSQCGEVCAHYTPTGILKIWNTATGSLDQSFTPCDNQNSHATCLAFNLKNEKNRSNTYTTNLEEIQFLAIGTLCGKLIVYCTTEKKVHNTLTHSPSAINDLTWSSNKILISLSRDKVIVFWDVLNSMKIRVIDVAANNKICFMGPNPDRFVITDVKIQIIELRKNGKEIKEHSFNSGQVTSISILIPIKIRNKVSKYFLTASKDSKHRHVYAWSTKVKTKKFLAAFKVSKGRVEAMSCVVEGDSSLILAVVTSKGNLQVFRHHLNGNVSVSAEVKPISSLDKLSLVSSVDNSIQLPIINCHFLSDSTLLIAYGPEFHQTWEKILIDKIEGKTQLVRNESRLNKKNKSTLVKTVAPLVPDNAATIVSNSSLDYRQIDVSKINGMESSKSRKRERDGSQNIPLEKCLDALSIKPSTSMGGAPLADGIHLLIQGLRSKDNEMIQSILSKGKDDDVLNNIVKRLPVEFLEPFFQYLQDLMSKGGKSLHCLKWLKSLLYHHMSHLSNVTSREMLMSPIIQWTSARMTIFSKVTKLHSRLNLLLTHVSARHENSLKIDAEPDPLLAFKDESDVESENEFGSDHRLHSESDGDYWDDLISSEDDEMKGTPNNAKANVSKRKSNVLENGEDSEMNDDEEEEDDDDDCKQSDI